MLIDNVFENLHWLLSSYMVEYIPVKFTGQSLVSSMTLRDGGLLKGGT